MNASVHPLTPTLAVISPRGEAVRQVEYLRTVAGEEVRALISRLQHDTAGHLVAQRYPRLLTPNTTTLHRLDGMALKTRNVDGGENTALPGLGGELLQNWDANGNHREMSYDPQLRLRSVKENGVADSETCTSSMAARSQIEADYKFTRYSGKEMDVTGLYYYGARCYAPWLARWISADPSGDAALVPPPAAAAAPAIVSIAPAIGMAVVPILGYRHLKEG